MAQLLAFWFQPVMGLGETLLLSSHKYTGPLSIVKIAKVCTVVVVKVKSVSVNKCKQ